MLPAKALQCQQPSCSASCLAVTAPEHFEKMEAKLGEVACNTVIALF